MKQAVVYARVSLEQQAQGEAVSIHQQLDQIRALCEHNSWGIIGQFVDSENYRASQQPNKGAIVNPSGERADRPEFLKMLEIIKGGNADIVCCWRDDRLVRHPRVALALEDALDQGDTRRNGRGPIQVSDATGAIIDRFTLSIKATIWREENKRRAERSKMGKLGTLQDGRWPGEYRRYGYKSVKIEGKRGRVIEIDEETAPLVRLIFEKYDAGIGITEIRKYLIGIGAPQIYTMLCRHEWSDSIINQIIRSPAYLGQAPWQFADGTTLDIPIPAIISRELWQRAQERMNRNKVLSPRNAGGIYPLQGLLFCGDCHHQMTVSRDKDHTGGYAYRCFVASNYPDENHPSPASHNGMRLDWAVWRRIVDYGLRNPAIIRDQIETRMIELQSEGNTTQAEILRIQQIIESTMEQRAFYQRQAARNKMSEDEFDQRMDETQEQLDHWGEELVRLRALAYETERVHASIDYAKSMFRDICTGLDVLDIPPSQLLALPEEERNYILTSRREIIRNLVDKVIINHQREIKIEGIINGSDSSGFDLGGY